MSIIHVYTFQLVWSDDVWNAYAPLANNLTLKSSVKYFVENDATTYLLSTANMQGGVTSISQLRTVGVNKKIKIVVMLPITP